MECPICKGNQELECHNPYAHEDGEPMMVMETCAYCGGKGRVEEQKEC